MNRDTEIYPQEIVNEAIKELKEIIDAVILKKVRSIGTK